MHPALVSCAFSILSVDTKIEGKIVGWLGVSEKLTDAYAINLEVEFLCQPK